MLGFGGSPESEQAEKDPEVQALARQFKVVAGELITLLEQVVRAS